MHESFIYIDELDKISKTKGKEIIGILTHLTDSTQNDQFNDKYFSGIDIDLSKVLFIFSYNDFSLLDTNLSRIHRVRFKHLSKRDKITIIEDYILPEILEMVGFSKESVKFDKDTIEFIITCAYTYEAGVRKLKERYLKLLEK